MDQFLTSFRTDPAMHPAQSNHSSLLPQRYAAAAVLCLLFAGCVIWFWVSRYESQQVATRVDIEQSKLEAIYALSTIAAEDAFSAFKALSARLTAVGSDQEAEATTAVCGSRATACLLKSALDAVPQFVAIEVYDAAGEFLAGAHRAGLTDDSSPPVLVSAPYGFFDLTRQSNSQGFTLFPPEAMKVRLQALRPVVPVVHGVATLATADATDGLVNVHVLYSLERLFRNARIVAENPPKSDYYRVAADGTFAMGGSRYPSYVYGADLGLEGVQFSDLHPDVWQAMQGRFRGVVTADDGVYVFRAHAVDIDQIRNPTSVWATSIIYLPWATLHESMLTRGNSGLSLLLLFALVYVLSVWGIWLYLRGRRQIAERDERLDNMLDRLERAMSFGRIGLLEIDADNETVTVNSVFASLHNIAGEVPNNLQQLLQALPDDVRKVIVETVAALRSTREPISREYSFQFHDGAQANYLLTADLTTTGNRAQHFRLLVADISELHTQRESLRRKADQQASMFKIIAHELRTPTAAIHMIASELDEAQSQKAELITAVNHLLSVIDDLRIAVNLETEVDNRAIQFELTQFLHEVERQVRQIFHDADMRLDMPDISVPVTLCGDAYRLRVVLTNLLRNAAYHSGGSHVVVAVDWKISAGEGLMQLQIRVDDNGRGIPLEQVDSLFAPFARGDTESSGTGVGLHIARSWIEVMGGTLVYDTSPLGGAAFVISVPLALASRDGSTLAVDGVPAVADWLQGKTVLLVEDDALLRKASQRLLEKSFSVSIELAVNGIEGLDKAREIAPALVITDMLMPQMNGVEMIMAMREAGINCPIIGLTAATIGSEQTELREAGADVVMAKPMTIDKLKAAIEQVIQER